MEENHCKEKNKWSRIIPDYNQLSHTILLGMFCIFKRVIFRFHGEFFEISPNRENHSALRPWKQGLYITPVINDSGFSGPPMCRQRSASLSIAPQHQAHTNLAEFILVSLHLSINKDHRGSGKRKSHLETPIRNAKVKRDVTPLPKKIL